LPSGVKLDGDRREPDKVGLDVVHFDERRSVVLTAVINSGK
jgi:hypothetical protein